MEKIIFRKIAGRVIPVKMGKKYSKFMTNQEATDHYAAKGMKKMIQEKTNGRNLHEAANVTSMLNHVESKPEFKGSSRILKRAKRFLREN